MNSEIFVRKYIIDGHSILIFLEQRLGKIVRVTVEVHNTNNENITVDLSKLRIKFNDWYYSVPWQIWVEPYHVRRIEDVNISPVDNLTYIEELANEKNLV